MRGKNLSWFLILGAVISGLSAQAQASPVSPSYLYTNVPTKVLIVDGRDSDSSVSLRFWLSTPSRAAFDFGFMHNNAYVSMMGEYRTQGDYTFLGGSLVDFALRNYGSDRLFGTTDDFIYRLSDNAGYVRQHYFAPIDPSHSSHPAVTTNYFQNLGLSWDLDLDGYFNAHALLEFKGSPYDGMMSSCLSGGPSPCPGEVTPVPVPGAIWLLGSGLIALTASLRRRRLAAN